MAERESLRKVDKDREVEGIGASDPIDAGGTGLQRATRASEKGFGPEGAICEYIEIMQILPVRTTTRCL
jgi:hypothetical protein